MSASLAAPSTGGAARRTSSAPSRVPAISLFLARGMTRTARITPSAVLTQNVELRAWNPHPEKVKAPLFASHAFFDPEDKAQVKYEMLRAHVVDGVSVRLDDAALAFTAEDL